MLCFATPNSLLCRTLSVLPAYLVCREPSSPQPRMPYMQLRTRVRAWPLGLGIPWNTTARRKAEQLGNIDDAEHRLVSKLHLAHIFTSNSKVQLRTAHNES